MNIAYGCDVSAGAVRASSAFGVDPKIFRVSLLHPDDTPPVLTGYITICMIDVLHHLPRSRQDGLIHDVVDRMGSGATLIFKDIDGAKRIGGFCNRIGLFFLGLGQPGCSFGPFSRLRRPKTTSSDSFCCVRATPPARGLRNRSDWSRSLLQDSSCLPKSGRFVDQGRASGLQRSDDGQESHRAHACRNARILLIDATARRPERRSQTNGHATRLRRL